MSSEKTVIVIGGGPAGIIAAGTAAARGHKVILIEKNDQIGKKLFISGKGRCNLTNHCSITELIENIPTNGNFLTDAFEQFSNQDLIDFFQQLGLETKIERGGRVFPVSDKSSDVIKALKIFLEKNNVRFIRAEVQKVSYPQNNLFQVLLNTGQSIKANALIIATGGLSYPITGSTGDGYIFAREAGHHIIKQRPALVPLETREKWVKKLDGLILKNVAATIYDASGNKQYSDFGELAFTATGVSGPIILSASSILKDLDQQRYSLEIDLKPALKEQNLHERIIREIKELANQDYASLLKKLLPGKLIPLFIEKTNLPSYQKVSGLKPENIENLIALLKKIKLTLIGYRPIEEAIVTAGGICVDEINPHTMESKLKKGLFFAGEIIDVDGFTGGFNIQIAFSTGYVAGMWCLN